MLEQFLLILKCLNNSTFFNVVGRQLKIKVLDIVDARCDHEAGSSSSSQDITRNLCHSNVPPHLLKICFAIIPPQNLALCSVSDQNVLRICTLPLAPDTRRQSYLPFMSSP